MGKGERAKSKVHVPTFQSLPNYFIDRNYLILLRKVILYGVDDVFCFFLRHFLSLYPRIQTIKIDAGNLCKRFITDVCASQCVQQFKRFLLLVQYPLTLLTNSSIESVFSIFLSTVGGGDGGVPPSLSSSISAIVEISIHPFGFLGSR